MNFSYGNKRVKYIKRNAYTDPVDNLHDLTIYEQTLTKRNVPWAVYVGTTKCDNKMRTKFVLIAEEKDE